MSKKNPEDIFNASRQLFAKYGIKSLTMDDIARHLGISKKTLYRYVKDKKELVQKCVALRIKGNQCVYREVEGKEGNAIDILMAINKEVSKELSQLHPSIMYDLQRYYPEAFKELLQHKEEFIYSQIYRNLELGIKQGLYRKNLNPEFISHIYINMVDFMMSNSNSKINIPDFSFTDFHKEIIRYHIRGIASEKGLQYLIEKFKNNDI